MMRLLGSVLVLGATLWFGAYFAAKEKYRLQELAELERAILLLQSQIAYLSAPLTEVLESVSWKAEGVIGEIFAQAAAVMAERERASAEEIWTEAWSKRRNQIFLTAEDLDMVLSFGKTLGYLDKAQQEGSICLLLRYLEEALAQGRKRLEKNGRLYYGIGGLSHYCNTAVRGEKMEINIVFRIAAVGILVAVLHQVLMRAGREEQAMLTTLAGLVVVLFWVIQYISQLFDTVQTLFQL